MPPLTMVGWIRSRYLPHMSFKPDLRQYADWYRSLSRSDRLNTLDDLADEMEELRREVETARAHRKGLLARAAHEAWLKAKAGGSPDEIAAAVKAIAVRAKR